MRLGELLAQGALVGAAARELEAELVRRRGVGGDDSALVRLGLEGSARLIALPAHPRELAFRFLLMRREQCGLRALLIGELLPQLSELEGDGRLPLVFDALRRRAPPREQPRPAL